MTHTPGPWVQAGESNGLRFIRANGKLVAQTGTAYDDDEQREANARLIAAAPDLLEAAKNLLANPTRESRKEAVDAIAKAEGQES